MCHREIREEQRRNISQNGFIRSIDTKLMRSSHLGLPAVVSQNTIMTTKAKIHSNP